MAFEKLKRTNYDHSGPHTARDHHQDFEGYHQTLNRMQNANLFDWGIVRGLNVTGNIGSNELQVNPGVGIDVGGRLISLATGGQGDIGDNPLVRPTPQHNLVPVPVTLTTAGFEAGPGSTRSVYVTIQFSEFCSRSPTDPLDPGDCEQIPWVRLQDSALFTNDGSALRLAKADIDENGNITAIHGDDRKIVETSLSKLSLRKGNFPRITSGTFDIKEDVTIEADGRSGNLRLGGNGSNGDLIIDNFYSQSTVSINGHSAELHMGGHGVGGNLRAMNSDNVVRIWLEGQSGNLQLHGQLQDGGGRNVGLTYDQKQGLTDGGETTLHKHDIGVLSWEGESGSRIGITGGTIWILKSGGSGVLTGEVTINLVDGTFTDARGGYRRGEVHGYRGVFRGLPHVLIEPAQFVLTTSAVFMQNHASISGPDRLKITWNIHAYSGSEQRFRFLVIGLISD